jgi:hypothetical protein
MSERHRRRQYSAIVIAIVLTILVLFFLHRTQQAALPQPRPVVATH